MTQAHLKNSVETALLNSSAGPGAVTAMQKLEALYQEIPKQQVDIALEALADSLRIQQRKFKEIKAFQVNFRDPLEARAVGGFCAELFPDPVRAKMGIMELLMNAVEHGNLCITAEEKHELIKDGTWMQEISRRLTLPRHKDKRVHVSGYQDNNCIQISIRDEGEGFNWENYITQHHVTPYAILNGRGIAVAKHIGFDEMWYSNEGNQVWGVQYLKD